MHSIQSAEQLWQTIIYDDDVINYQPRSPTRVCILTFSLQHDWVRIMNAKTTILGVNPLETLNTLRLPYYKKIPRSKPLAECSNILKAKIWKLALHVPLTLSDPRSRVLTLTDPQGLPPKGEFLGGNLQRNVSRGLISRYRRKRPRQIYGQW